jgi:hypothetical protein
VNAKQKNLVSLLVFAAVAAGLGLYAYFGVMKPEQTEAERKAASDKLFATHAPGELGEDGGAPPAPYVTSMTVEAKGTTTVLERKGPRWVITSPVEAPADDTVVSLVLDQLLKGQVTATVSENPTEEELQRFGLQPPTFIVKAKAYVPDAQGGGEQDPARQRTVTLYGGIENTFDGSVYLRRDEDPKVYSAPGGVRMALDRDTSELRERKVFGLDKLALRRIEVKGKKGSYTLERTPVEMAWYMVQPVQLLVNSDLVGEKLVNLAERRAVSFPEDSAETRVKLGLDKPVLDAHFTLDPGEPVRLRVSRVEEGGTPRVYALREQGSEALLVEVKEALIGDLDMSPEELRDRRVLAYQLGEERMVAFHLGGKTPTLVVEKQAHTEPDRPAYTWEVLPPAQGQVQQVKVAALLGKLADVKVAAFGERPKSWATYGITDTSRGVTLVGEKGEMLARLLVGQEVKGKPGRVWVRGSHDEVLEVEKAALGDLPASEADLLEAKKPEAVTPTP